VVDLEDQNGRLFEDLERLKSLHAEQCRETVRHQHAHRRAARALRLLYWLGFKRRCKENADLKDQNGRLFEDLERLKRVHAEQCRETVRHRHARRYVVQVLRSLYWLLWWHPEACRIVREGGNR